MIVYNVVGFITALSDGVLQPFYARLGMQPALGMARRNYVRQSGVELAKGENKRE